MQADCLKFIMSLAVFFSGLTSFGKSISHFLSGDFSTHFLSAQLVAQLNDLSDPVVDPGDKRQVKRAFYKKLREAKRSFFDELAYERSLSGTAFDYKKPTAEVLVEELDRQILKTQMQLDSLNTDRIFADLFSFGSIFRDKKRLELLQQLATLNYFKEFFSDRLATNYLLGGTLYPSIIFALAASGHLEKRIHAKVAAQDSLEFLNAVLDNAKDYTLKEQKHASIIKRAILKFLNSGVFDLELGLSLELTDPKKEARISFPRTFDGQLVKGAPIDLFLYDFIFGPWDRLVAISN